MLEPPWGKLRIGAVDWEVTPNEHSLVHGSLGDTVHRDRRILLHPSRGHWPTRESALHETLHAISISLWPAGHDDEMTEAQTIALTTLLLSVLRDNPDFACWLVKPDGRMD